MHTKLWNKDYILLLQGNAFSAIGDLLYSVAIGYWVYDQTGSSAFHVYGYVSVALYRQYH